MSLPTPSRPPGTSGQTGIRVVTVGDGCIPRSHARAATRVLGLAFCFAGLLGLVTVVLPFSPTAPTGLGAVLSSVSLLLGAALVRTRRCVPPPVLHGLVAVGSLGVAGSVAASTTQAGPAVTAWGFVWVALYSASFHGRRALTAHLALVAAGLATGLVVSEAPSALQTWVFITATTGAVAAIVHVKVARLRSLADHDPLTGLLTRTAFTAAVDAATSTAQRTGQPLTLALLDLDDFKAVNDTEGHARGDQLLADVAAAWRATLRRGDVLGRRGGDEFVLLMPATTASGAVDVLARLAAAAPAVRWTHGIAEWEGEALEPWIARADAALYRAKRRRR